MAQELIRDGKLDRQATVDALRLFLEKIVRVSGLDLKVNVRPISAGGEGLGGDAEVLADLDGRDKEILLEHGAEVLKAFEHLAFRALRLETAYHEKIHIDSGGYPAVRFAELRMSPPGAPQHLQTSHPPVPAKPLSLVCPLLVN